MKTVVFLRLGFDPDDPIAEIQMTDPGVLPSIGDTIAFPTDDDNGLTGTVTKRVFRPLPFHVEIDVMAEPS